MSSSKSNRPRSIEAVAALCRLFAVGIMLVLPLTAYARECDPDLTGNDRITKQQVEQWQQVLTSTGFLSAALMDNDVTFTAFVTRTGDKNTITVVIQKVEENLARAAFETQYRAAKGDEILFGFKNGTPVTLVTTKAGNSAKAGSFSGKLNMSAVWEAELSDADASNYRAALTTKLIDAVRITAASGQIDRAIPERNAQRLMQKFACFYRKLDYSGVGVAVGQDAAEQYSGGSPLSGGGGSPLEAAVRSTANCRANFSVGGSMVRGTSYETYDEFVGLTYTSAMDAVKSSIAGASLAVESSEPTAGTLRATGQTAKGKDVTFDFTVVPTSGGVRVSIAQKLRVGKHGADDAVKDSMCRILSAIAESTAKAEPPKEPVSKASKSSEAKSPPTVPNATKPAAPVTVEERLRQLDDIFKKGLITEDEYKKKRALILSSL